MSQLITLTDFNFDTVLAQSELPVLVDYFAPWCAPCRVLDPVVEQIAAERGGELIVGNVNVDEQPRLADRAGVQGIPALVLYRDGRPVARAVGAHPRRTLEQALGLDSDGWAAA